jgi:HlyD family secretion protein
MLRHHVISDIAECTEFRQTIAAQPPRIVHGTVLILSFLLICALGWAAWTRVNLVVLAKGRIRPKEIPTHIYTPSGAEFVGRVVFAPFDEGDSVKKGDVLIRLDTSRIDNLIAKLNRTIEGCELELTNLATQRELLQSQALAANQKSQVELLMAEETFDHSRLKRDSEIRDTQADHKAAEEHFRRLKKLQQNKAVSQQELDEAETKLHSAQEKLVQAQLPVDGATVSIARQSIELVSRDFAVRKAELESRIVVKQSDKEAVQRDLANLEMQRSDAVLLAPFDGIIVSGRVRVGDMLEAGKPVYELAQQQSSCFEAVVSAEDVGQLTVGLPVRIRFDAYDYQQYGTLNGTVLFISPDSKPIESGKQSDRGLVAAEKTAAFSIRVQLHSEKIGYQGAIRVPVKLGLTGTAEIITDNESLLNVLLKHIRRTISLV